VYYFLRAWRRRIDGDAIYGFGVVCKKNKKPPVLGGRGIVRLLAAPYSLTPYERFKTPQKK